MHFCTLIQNSTLPPKNGHRASFFESQIHTNQDISRYHNYKSILSASHKLHINSDAHCHSQMDSGPSLPLPQSQQSPQPSPQHHSFPSATPPTRVPYSSPLPPLLPS